MKEHGNKHPAAAEPAGTKTLKSLLKKPGQTKAKSQKHRVVINEKLNEFFAADYIILIKEECCADYEEDCDCCYQEHEFMRLGNCKECRAELNLHFGLGNGRYGGEMPPRGVEQALCEEAAARAGPRSGKGQQPGREDSQEDDDEEDEEEADDAEEEEDDEEEREDEEEDETDHVDGGKVEKMSTMSTSTSTSLEGKDASERKNADAPEDAGTKGRGQRSKESADSQEENGTVVPPPPPPPRHEQQETLSPPEGYKDVCSDSEIANETEQRSRTCAECNYYQQQAPGESFLVLLINLNSLIFSINTW